MERTKICFKCGEEKVLSAYYKHKQMGDGHLNKCKDCTKKDVRERESKLLEDPDWVDAERARHREKYYRLGYKEKHKPTAEDKRKAMKAYKERYPEKESAQIRSSRITASEGMEKHHWSYQHKHHIDIIELSPKEHAKAHRFLVYDQQKKMYRDLDGRLLDTKNAHEMYIREMIQTKPD